MSDDLIKRSDAIKATRSTVAQYVPFLNGVNKTLPLECETALRTIPSADRPQGEWIKHDEERDYCSRCKHIFKTRTITKQDKWTNYIDDLGYNYCPNCGSRNRKENE